MTLVLRRLPALLAILCLIPLMFAAAETAEDNAHLDVSDCAFSVLILGDSQMAGAGWDGGYANCIAETYPEAQMLNLAADGSRLAEGGIHAQWSLYLREDLPLPDFVLLDGGINDLPRLRQQEYSSEAVQEVEDAFCSLVEAIHTASPDTHIIYLLMPPFPEWEDSQSGPPSYEIQARFWKRMNIIASTYDYVTVVDLFSLNPFLYPCAACYREYLTDGIHLSEAGYRTTYTYLDNILVACLMRRLEE